MNRLRALALGMTAALASVALAAPAWAHVTVNAPDAAPGGTDQEITFRVPVEKDVDTVGVTVALPTATPIASVSVRPIPGWTHAQKSTELAAPITTDDGDITSAVSQISWTAQRGHGLATGEYGDFTIIAGQLPDSSTLTFKVLQTYQDGSVVRWIELAAPGSSSEPEDPAPVLTLAASGGPQTTRLSETPAVLSTAASASSDTGAITLSIIALVVAAGALGFVVLTRARHR